MKNFHSLFALVLIWVIDLIGQDTAQVSIPLEMYDNSGGLKTLYVGVHATATLFNYL